jgi:hypothetical protein
VRRHHHAGEPGRKDERRGRPETAGALQRRLGVPERDGQIGEHEHVEPMGEIDRAGRMIEKAAELSPQRQRRDRRRHEQGQRPRHENAPRERAAEGPREHGNVGGAARGHSVDKSE